MLEKELSVDQQIRMLAIQQAVSYYQMKLRLMRSAGMILDKEGEDEAIGFAKKLAKFIKDG